MADVECLALRLGVVKDLLGASRDAAGEVDRVLRRRLIQLGAIHGLAVRDEVQADDETVLKTQMIRRRLQLIESRRDARLLRDLLDNS